VVIVVLSAALLALPSMAEITGGIRCWWSHHQNEECLHPATERFQGFCDAGLRMFWSKGLD
jgi:hypothetical protein